MLVALLFRQRVKQITPLIGVDVIEVGVRESGGFGQRPSGRCWFKLVTHVFLSVSDNCGKASTMAMVSTETRTTRLTRSMM